MKNLFQPCTYCGGNGTIVSSRAWRDGGAEVCQACNGRGVVEGERVGTIALGMLIIVVAMVVGVAGFWFMNGGVVA